MPGKKEQSSRRDFIKTAGAAGLGSSLIPLSSLTLAYGSSSEKEPEEVVVPFNPYSITSLKRSVK